MISCFCFLVNSAAPRRSSGSFARSFGHISAVVGFILVRWFIQAHPFARAQGIVGMIHFVWIPRERSRCRQVHSRSFVEFGRARGVVRFIRDHFVH